MSVPSFHQHLAGGNGTTIPETHISGVRSFDTTLLAAWRAAGLGMSNGQVMLCLPNEILVIHGVLRHEGRHTRRQVRLCGK